MVPAVRGIVTNLIAGSLLLGVGVACVLKGRSNIRKQGMALHAGHGLNYRNVFPVAQLPNMFELNIGHSIVARALFVGMREAVREMRQLIRDGAQETG